MGAGKSHITLHDLDVIYKAARKNGYSEVEVEVDIDRRTITAIARDGRTTESNDQNSKQNGKPKNDWDNI